MRKNYSRQERKSSKGRILLLKTLTGIALVEEKSSEKNWMNVLILKSNKKHSRKKKQSNINLIALDKFLVHVEIS